MNADDLVTEDVMMQGVLEKLRARIEVVVSPAVLAQGKLTVADLLSKSLAGKIYTYIVDLPMEPLQTFDIWVPKTWFDHFRSECFPVFLAPKKGGLSDWSKGGGLFPDPMKWGKRGWWFCRLLVFTADIFHKDGNGYTWLWKLLFAGFGIKQKKISVDVSAVYPKLRYAFPEDQAGARFSYKRIEDEE